MLSNLKLFAFVLLAVVCHKSNYSQEPKSILENDKQIVYKLSVFSIENEALIRKAFQSEKQFQIVYVCQEAGIIVIESKNTITHSDKDKIASKIKNAIQKSEVKEENCTYKDAENNCILKSKTDKKK